MSPEFGLSCEIWFVKNKLNQGFIQDQNEEEIFKLRTENNRLEALVKTLRRELEESRTAHNKTRLVTNNDESKVNELKLDIIQTKQELSRAKEALQGE